MVIKGRRGKGAKEQRETDEGEDYDRKCTQEQVRRGRPRKGKENGEKETQGEDME